MRTRILLCCCLLGLTLWSSSVHAGESGTPEQGAAWMVYWDGAGVLEEAQQLGDGLHAIVYFAAYFDDTDFLFVPSELDSLYDETEKLFGDAMPFRYLSVVNDREQASGSPLIKDTEILEMLFETPESIDLHVRDLISLAKDYGYDGLEIDYERIRDQALWEDFSAFIHALVPQAAEAGLQLRVLFEPSAPLRKLTFPEGPEYVMMCYNLYGDHGGPGPKADPDFLADMVKSMQYLPGRKTFALATGGFEWVGGKNARAVTQLQALSLAEEFQAEPARDEKSGAMFFTYQDSLKRTHEVWFADDVTLQHWAQTIRDSGDYGVDIWRLGGNLGLENLR